MQLPKIKLDAPQTNQNAFTTVDSKATLQLFGADGETPWTPASTEADISRFAVEWNAVNYSKETGEGLADKYQLEITSADDKTTDKITFTVAERNVMDEKGTITTKCGEILSVTKEVTIKDTAYTITIPQSEENGRTFYDLTTTVKTDVNGEAVLGEDKTPVLTMNHVTLEGHYELKDASGTPRYKLETFATLEYLDRDGEPGYRVTLPDLVDLLHKDDTRQRITGKVTVRAEGDAEKTTQSEKLELTVPNDGTAPPIPDSRGAAHTGRCSRAKPCRSTHRFCGRRVSCGQRLKRLQLRKRSCLQWDNTMKEGIPMGRKARGIMQNQQGLSMILVLCIGAVFAALSAALVYAASVLTANANRQLIEQEVYTLATSFSDVLDDQLTGYSMAAGSAQADSLAAFIDKTYLLQTTYSDATEHTFADESSGLEITLKKRRLTRWIKASMLQRWQQRAMTLLHLTASLTALKIRNCRIMLWR